MIGRLVLGVALAVACTPRQSDSPNSAQAFGRAPGSLDGAQFLGDDAKQARQAGAGQSQVLAVEAGANGDRITSLFWVPDAECALVIARASESVDDIDLFVYGDDGTSFGTDEAPDKSPSVLLCPPHPRRMFAVARIAGGHGVVAIGVQRVPAKHASAVRKAIKSRSAKSAAARERARVDARIFAHRRQLGGQWRDLRRVALPVDARLPTRASLAVRAGHCVDILAAPTRGVGPLDLDLIATDGRVVGRGHLDGRDRFIVACSERQAHLTVQVRPRSGNGPIWLVVSESQAGARSTLADYAGLVDLGPSLPLPKLRAALEASLSDQPYGPTKRVHQGTLGTGTRRSVSLPPPQGCQRIDVLGGAPLFGLRAWAYSDSGQLIARARGAGRASMLLCGDEPIRLDLEATLSPGPVVALLRKDPDAPIVLRKHPLAASRLMAAIWSRGSAVVSREIAGVQAKRLESTSLQRIDVRIAVKRCMDFFVALGAGAEGVEMRLLDVGSGHELTRVHGAHAASARICADKGTIDTRVELKALAGRATGLFATRMSKLTR